MHACLVPSWRHHSAVGVAFEAKGAGGLVTETEVLLVPMLGKRKFPVVYAIHSYLVERRRRGTHTRHGHHCTYHHIFEGLWEESDIAVAADDHVYHSEYHSDHHDRMEGKAAEHVVLVEGYSGLPC